MLDTAARQNRSLEHLGHRPWPVPARGWIMGQTWEDLLFAHWRVPVEKVRQHVRDDLEVDVHDGSAWLGITPFRLTGLRGRGMLPIPYVSSFLELNVRTYVRAKAGSGVGGAAAARPENRAAYGDPGDKPGIWFFSLDASSRVAVEVARRTYKLPYFHARMSAAKRGEWTDYECSRIDEAGRVFSGRYRPNGSVFNAEPGSLEWFLTERYCLYTPTGERADIHHVLWDLQPAEAEIDLASISPVELRGEPLLHFSRRQDVVIWPLENVG